MPGSTRGSGRRQRPRTAPDVSLSPVERAYASAANGRSRGAAGGGRLPAVRSNGGAGGGSEANTGAGGGSPVEQPELLSRFIPADPWVGRVSLSSPQALSGLVAAMGKHGGGGGGASSGPSPNGNVVSINGNNDSNNNNNNVGGSSNSSTIGASSSGSNEQGAGAGGVLGLKGMTGLRNEGNWCYLNASLQALARCAPFRAHLVECVPTQNVAGRPCPLAYSMSELYTEMWSEDTAVGGGGGRRRAAETPANVLRALVRGNRWFAGNGQHDAHEALRSILDLLHEELRRPVPASFEPGHAALTAAMAASSAETAAADAAATAPATAAPDGSAEVGPATAGNAEKQQKLSIEGKATTPSEAGGGAWTVSGGWEGNENSTKRVTSAEGAIAQQQQRDVYWQSAAAETFQGVLLGRITCRTCGRHSDQPDRFYDLSVPLLAGSAGSAASSATNNGGAPPASAATATSALSTSAPGRGDRHRHYDYHNHHHHNNNNNVTPGAGIITPTMESPRPDWEPSLSNAGTNGGEKRITSIRSTTTVGDSEAAGGDRSSDWGSWRRTRGGWCSAARDDDGSGDGDGQGGAGAGSGGREGRSPSYFGGLASSLGVWLGFKSVTLEDCLEAFFSPERLRGANQYHCDGCGSKKEADKSTSLLHAPEILVLHVKRFRRGYLWSHKVHNRVIFPLHDLDMSRWLSEHAAESSANQQRVSAGGSGGDAHRKSSLRRGSGSPDGGGYYYGGSTATAAAVAAAESAAAAFSPTSPAPVLYDLVGLVQHTGGLEHGHYTSYTRDEGSATWYHFNDTMVSQVSQGTVSSASPYILFYRRKRPSSSSTASTTAPSGAHTVSRPMSMSAAASAAATAAAATAAAGTASLLSSVGIGPAAEEARDVRSRVEIMAREMAKAGGGGGGGGGGMANNASSSTAGTVGAEAAAAAANAGDNQARMSIGGGGGGGGGVSDTDGEGGGPGAGAGARSRLSRRRKGRGRRPGSESESEGSTGGSNSWVYMSKAWALKWATSAYPGPVSNHHVVCRHGRVKPNIGVKRATKEMVAVPRGVHRSLVNRYGPRTPAMVPAKPSPLGGKAATVPGESANRVSVGRGRGRGHGMALVGSSRPLLELSSCTACKALEEEMVLLKSAEQKEVAGLSKVGQERRKRRKAARSARQRRRAGEGRGSTPESDARRSSGNGGTVVDGGAGAVTPTPIGESHAGRDRLGRRANDGADGEGGSAGMTVAAATDGVGVGGGEEEGSTPGGGGGDGVSSSGDGDDGAGSDEDQAAGTPPAQEEEEEREEDGFGDDEQGDEEDDEEEEEEEEEEDEKWFLMAGTWLSRWHAYVLSGTGEDLDFPTPPPGPITNGDLVDEDSVPIPGKIAGKHYRGAMIEVWSYLHRRYGGGPVVCRSDPDGLYERGPADSKGSSS